MSNEEAKIYLRNWRNAIESCEDIDISDDICSLNMAIEALEFRDSFAPKMDEYLSTIKELKAERDAAIKDLEHNCGNCVHRYITPFDDCNCQLGVSNCNWEWRGINRD